MKKFTLLMIVIPVLVGSTAAAQDAVGGNSNNRLNPEISVNIAALGGYTTRGDTEEEGLLERGLGVQEIELRFGADADPYFRLDIAIAGHAHAGEVAAEFEEAYLSTTSLPDVIFRLGILRPAFGVASQSHTHARRFINTPLPIIHLFETDHLIGTGVSVDYLLPLPFFTELNLQSFQTRWTRSSDAHGHEESSSSEGHDDHEGHDDLAYDFSYVARLKSSFDLGDATTMELGFSGLLQADDEHHWRESAGADFRIKWVPPSSARYTSLEWLTEYMTANRSDARRDGVYSGIRYQVDQQWWFQARGALLDINSSTEKQTYRAETLVAFAPSERTALRLHYGFEHTSETHHEEEGEHSDHGQGRSPVHEVFLQFIVSVGSHPAHAY
jgi:hypothetical protein